VARVAAHERRNDRDREEHGRRRGNGRAARNSTAPRARANCVRFITGLHGLGSQARQDGFVDAIRLRAQGLGRGEFPPPRVGSRSCGDAPSSGLEIQAEIGGRGRQLAVEVGREQFVALVVG
jgi:hypothetical protein